MDDKHFSRDSQHRFSGWERRGPQGAGVPADGPSWAEGIPALAAEHRGSLAEAEADAAYRWIATFCSGRTVLDVGCGAGLGAGTLIDSGASSVVGTDRRPDAIEAARLLHGERAAFVVSEPFALPFANDSFDVVICLADLEEPTIALPALSTLCRVLAPDGVLVISLSTEHQRDPIDGRVIHEAVDIERWVARLGESFANVQVLHRRVCLGAAVHAAETDQQIDSVRWLGAERAEDRAVLISASNGKLPTPKPTATLVGGRDLRAYRATVAAWEQRARRAEADGAAKHWELVASREAQRRLRKRLWELEHRPLRRLWRLVRGRPATLAEGPQLRPPELEEEPWN